MFKGIYKNDDQLPELIIKASRIVKAQKTRKNLLPNEYKQKIVFSMLPCLLMISGLQIRTGFVLIQHL